MALSSVINTAWALALVILSIQLQVCVGQESTIVFSVDTGDGLVYFLLILFFAIVFFTPVARWIYVRYLAAFVEKAGKEINKVSKRFSDRMSDVSRKVSQSVRSA